MATSTHILIDFENVQPEDLTRLDEKHFNVLVFVGANQNKIPFEVAAVLQRMRERADYVKISGTARNALDFHIAFYIGKIAAKNPAAHFYIVSNDTGFDPLIIHLKDRKLTINRVADITEIVGEKVTSKSSSNESPAIVATKSASKPADKLEVVIEQLRKKKASKPRTIETLTRTIAADFHKQLSLAEIKEIIKGLEAGGIIAVEGKKVTYELPSAGLF